jgi:hypothetical protein
MTTDEIVKRLRYWGSMGRSVSIVDDALVAADLIEALEAENKRLRDGLIDMLDLAEMLAGNEEYKTYIARFKYARAALKGET